MASDGKKSVKPEGWRLVKASRKGGLGRSAGVGHGLGKREEEKEGKVGNDSPVGNLAFYFRVLPIKEKGTVTPKTGGGE